MRVMQLAWLVLAFIAVSEAQKRPKHKAPADTSSQYSPAGPSGAGYQTQNQYQYAPTGQSSQGHGGHGQGHGHGGQAQYQGSYSGGLAGPAGAKPNHALLLSDSRTLNHDGTINFNYAADNGLQQGETVDPDGTRRGYYSYPGADGKAITVKYTAGKNGFVAEGDHLPRQPNSAAHSEKDEVVAKGHGGGHGAHSGAYYGNAAGPSYPAHSHKPVAQAYGGHEHRPKPYSGGGGHHGGGHYNGDAHGQGVPAVQYSHGPAPHHSNGGHGSGRGQGFGGVGFGPAGPAFRDFGPVNYGAPSHGGHGNAHAAPQTQYETHARPHGGGGGQGFGRGPVHSALNPYQHSSGAGPYSGQFDLGNGGQFSIDFNPGKAQAVPIGGDFGGHLQGQPQAQRY